MMLKWRAFGPRAISSLSGGRFRAPALAAIAVLSFTAAPALADGQRIYVDNGCQVCHGGMGMGGVGPAFRHDPFLALPDYAIARVLDGGGAMPGFSDRLSDADVAGVVNYLLSTWGGRPGNVIPNDVAAIRKQVVPGPSAKGTAEDVGPTP